MEVILRWNFQVVDGATGFTHEMIMRLNKCVVAAEPFPKIQLEDFPLLLEHVEIAIDRTQRNMRYLLADFLVNPFRGRMGAGLFQHLIDFLALLTTLRPLHKNILLQNSGLNISKDGANVKKSGALAKKQWTDQNGRPPRTYGVTP